ncbi:MAG TPA: type I methionyl aminopeptidase [Acidobacteriota bacterium]
MIVIKSGAELAKLRRSNVLVAQILAALRQACVAGATTYDLERLALERVEGAGARAAFKGYRGYPACLCTSINEEVVHGIPSPRRRLREGDIVSIDLGVLLDGYYGDSAITVAIGPVGAEARRLLEATERALYAGIEAARPGNRLSDISHQIQHCAEAYGFSVVRDFVGHGIGTQLHEEPQLPNYGAPGRGPKLAPGMVLAIEPMVNQGGPEVEVLEDHWTAVTCDRKLSAHFEHSVAITENGPWILSRLESPDRAMELEAEAGGSLADARSIGASLQRAP